MKRKTIVTLTVTMMLLVALAACNRGKGSTATANPESDFDFYDAAITKYTGKASAVTIPLSIQGQQITEIQYKAFEGKGLTDITIPEGIQIILERAFTDNLLTNITIPNSVSIISPEAFRNNRLKSITIGANVELAWIIGYGDYGIDAFDDDFDAVYKSNGKQAGTYTLNNGVWSLNGTALTATPAVLQTAPTAGQGADDKWWDVEPTITDTHDQVWKYNNTDITATWTRGMLSFSGTGVLDGNTSNGFYPWQDPHLDVNIVIIPSEITRIGVGAFTGKSITSITIGANVDLGMRGGANYLPAFNENFETVYYNGGQQAGTYFLRDGVWSKADAEG